VAKAGEKDSKEAEPKTAKTPAAGKDAPASPKPGEDSTHKNGAAPAVEAAGELSLEDDLQLQKAVELLKTWKIFKELRPA
jgi:carboxyl-terminal processing protease